MACLSLGQSMNFGWASIVTCGNDVGGGHTGGEQCLISPPLSFHSLGRKNENVNKECEREEKWSLGPEFSGWQLKLYIL